MLDNLCFTLCFCLLSISFSKSLRKIIKTTILLTFNGVSIFDLIIQQDEFHSLHNVINFKRLLLAIVLWYLRGNHLSISKRFYIILKFFNLFKAAECPYQVFAMVIVEWE